MNDFIDQVLAVEAAAAIWRETQRSAHDVIVPREQAPKWQPLRPALQVSIVAVQPHLPTRSRASFNAEREFYKKTQSIGNNRGVNLMFVGRSPVALFG